MIMRGSKLLIAISILGGSFILSSAPALAYVACNHDGDCWRTGSKSLDWSGVIIKYHDDDWWDAHKADAEYHFHDADAEHQWDRGYWRKGQWVRGF